MQCHTQSTRSNRDLPCFTVFFRDSSNFRKHGKSRTNAASHGVSRSVPLTSCKLFICVRLVFRKRAFAHQTTVCTDSKFHHRLDLTCVLCECHCLRPQAPHFNVCTASQLYFIVFVSFFFLVCTALVAPTHDRHAWVVSVHTTVPMIRVGLTSLWIETVIGTCVAPPVGWSAGWALIAGATSRVRW